MTVPVSRLEWLDFFRGIAAIIVVIFHFHTPLGVPRLDSGFLAVDLFFVLSEIVLGIRYTASIENGMTFRHFSWQRIRRLYPMAVITAIFICILNLLDMPEGKFIITSGSWGPALSTLFVVPYPARFGLFGPFPADAPMWSLWAELISNIFWFIALRFGRALTALMFGFALTMFIVIAVGYGSVDYGFRGGIVELIKGVVRALAGFGVGYFIARHRLPSRKIPTWLLLICLVVAMGIFQMHLLNDVVAALVVLLIGIFLLINLMHVQPKQGSVVAKLCALLGMLSYPLYLIHVPAGRLALGAMKLGVSPVVSHVVVILSVGTVAAWLNEQFVRNLPR